MLDSDLARLYDVPTKSLNLTVQRNKKRFPHDFMFRLTSKEHAALRFQIEASNKGRGGARYLPYAFTENGVAMLSSVLRSEKAIEVNIAIMRTFTKMSKMLKGHEAIWRKLREVESKYDGQFSAVFEAIRQLVIFEEKPKRKIGYVAE